MTKIIIEVRRLQFDVDSLCRRRTAKLADNAQIGRALYRKESFGEVSRLRIAVHITSWAGTWAGRRHVLGEPSAGGAEYLVSAAVLLGAKADLVLDDTIRYEMLF